MSEHQNQHYVPAGFLRKFAITSAHSKSLIWAYDKGRGEVCKNPVSVRRICSKPRYYEIPTKDGGLDHEAIERHLEKIEDRALRVIDKLRRQAHSPTACISTNARSELALFLGMLLSRNPAFRDGIHELHRKVVKVTLNELERKGALPDLPEVLQEQRKSLPLSEMLDVEIKEWISVVPMLNAAVMIAESMLKKNWVFVVPANDVSFLTSDNPVCIGLPHLVSQQLGRMPFGPAHPVCEVSVPLARDLGVVCTPRFAHGSISLTLPDGTVKRLNKDETTGYNGRSIGSAVRYVYAPWKSDETLAQVKKLRNEKQRLAAS